MRVKMAAEFMLARITHGKTQKIESRQDEEGLSAGHARWMIEQMLKTDMSDGKLNRWLGWAQALMAINGLMTLEESKQLNRDCSCEHEYCPKAGTLHSHEAWDTFTFREEGQRAKDPDRTAVQLPDGEWWNVFAVSREDAIGDALVNYISEDAYNLLREIESYDGMETRVEWYQEEGRFKELLDAKLINLGHARGPDQAWKRATASIER